MGVSEHLQGDQRWIPLAHTEGTLLKCKWKGKTVNNATMEMPQLVVERLIGELFPCDRRLKEYTELYIEEDDRGGAPRLVRCHPFHQGKPRQTVIRLVFGQFPATR
jgi:hypothetical protein